MPQIRYLLDENVDPALRSALLSRDENLIVRQVGRLEAPPFGTLDPEILVWCERHHFILVTNNRTSMPMHLKDHLAAGGKADGIFILNTTLSFGETADVLVLIALASSAEDYEGQITFLPVN